MRVEIKKLQRQFDTTSIYVTHDQLEAMTLADMLVVMNGGRVEQIGAPLDVYQQPATTFVATFIGAPPMNLLHLTGADFAQLVGGAAPAEGRILGIRPEDLELAPAGEQPTDAVAFPLIVEAVERVGPESFIYGKLTRGGDVIVRIAGVDVPALGETVFAYTDRDKLHVFSADGSRRVEL
jgi:sn-glycerol 3-phosphate transport system ATP-binding protein